MGGWWVVGCNETGVASPLVAEHERLLTRDTPNLHGSLVQLLLYSVVWLSHESISWCLMSADTSRLVKLLSQQATPVHVLST